MSAQMTPLMAGGQYFAYVGGIAFLVIGIYLSYRRRRLHPLLLLCISAISFSWIEAPYDWAMYAQFPPALPRMPSWWPLNMTWGGLPSSVPIGYISYFVHSRRDRRRARAMAERKVPLAQADHPAGGRSRRRLLLGIVLQRVPGSPARHLLLRLRDSRPRDIRGDQAPVPALRLARDGHADDGLHLSAGPHRCRGTQCHRDVGRQAIEEPSCSRRCCPSSPSSSSETCSTARFSRRISSRSWAVGSPQVPRLSCSQACRTNPGRLSPTRVRPTPS